MKHIAAQEVMKLPVPRVRKDRVFKRPDSRFWQVKLWFNGKPFRRTTLALTEAGALDIIGPMRAHLERQFLNSPPRDLSTPTTQPLLNV